MNYKIVSIDDKIILGCLRGANPDDMCITHLGLHCTESGLDDHIVRVRGILPCLLGSLARALLRTSAFLTLRYDLHTRITIAALGGARGAPVLVLG